MHGGHETLQLSSLFSRWLNFNSVSCHRVSHDKQLVLLEIKGNTLVNRTRLLGTRKQASTNMHGCMTLRVDFVVGFSLLL